MTAMPEPSPPLSPRHWPTWLLIGVGWTLAAYALAYPVAPQHALVLAIALSLAAGFWLAEKSHADD